MTATAYGMRPIEQQTIDANAPQRKGQPVLRGAVFCLLERGDPSFFPSYAIVFNHFLKNSGPLDSTHPPVWRLDMLTSPSFLAISRAHWQRKAKALAIVALSVALLYGQWHGVGVGFGLS